MCEFPRHGNSKTAKNNKSETALYDEVWVLDIFCGGGGKGKRAGRSATGVKEREAEMVSDREGAGMNKSIVHGCGMKGRSLPACD